MRRRGVIRALVGAPLLCVLALWGVSVGGMLAERHALIYRFDRWITDARAVGKGGEVIEVEAADGTPVAVWYEAPRDGRPLILHFGGNVGALTRAVDRVLPLTRAGYGAAVMAYRGSSSMPGEPSQDAIVADSLAVYDRFAGDRPPVVYGTSLGAAVAAQLAARRPVEAAILAAPFASLCSTAEHHHPWTLACWVMWDERWDTEAVIGRIEAPILILHGEEDRLIPVVQARRVAEAAGERATLVTYPDAGHRDLMHHGAEHDVFAFLDALSD